MEAPLLSVPVKDAPRLMNTMWTVSVLPHWLFITGWKVQDFQISMHTWENLRASSQMVLLYILISCSLSILHGKKGGWEWTWRFFLNILAMEVFTCSAQVRLVGSETCSDNGTFLTMNFSGLMNFWTLFYWIFTGMVSYRNFLWYGSVYKYLDIINNKTEVESLSGELFV